MAFTRFRPTSHFIAPHSWSNDPCGAVYIPEIKEYLFCYQWNPGTTDGGNCAWGMARSKDLVTWQDCAPAIRNGATYDSLGVFSGSIVSRLVEGKRVLFLFYTSVSAVPIHWSLPYLDGCESQSVAFSTDFGVSWNRYENNPLLTTPPKGPATTGWRDPFVSTWPSMSKLIGMDEATNYMMIASGERNRASQLHLYSSSDLLAWEPLHTILDVEAGKNISKHSELKFGMNFECASFFTLGAQDYIIMGIEEDKTSKHHDGHYVIWLSGNLVLEEGKPRFDIKSHGLLDNGVAYAPHIFRDAEGRLLQLGWANEVAKSHIVKSQGWAGCLAHPREIYEISRPISESGRDNDIWTIDEKSGTMTTLGIRPASQVATLRQSSSRGLESFNSIRSKNYEVEATFSNITGDEIFVFNVRESPQTAEVTKLIFDVANEQVVVDRSQSSLEMLGTNTPDSGRCQLLPAEELQVRFFVDESMIEIYINDRFALTSRIYPSLESSTGASFEFGDFDKDSIKFEYWEGLKNAWPSRKENESILGELHPLAEMKPKSKMTDGGEMVRQVALSA